MNETFKDPDTRIKQWKSFNIVQLFAPDFKVIVFKIKRPHIHFRINTENSLLQIQQAGIF